MKKIYSFRDRRGCLWVSCAECERGGNGSQKNTCVAGYNAKNGSRCGGCFCGEPMPGIAEKAKTFIGR